MMGLLVFAQAELNRGGNDLTVVDSETKLEWQDSYVNNAIPNTYWSASVSYCHGLELDNKDDWRLPNINELKTIVEETQYAPTINEVFNHTGNYRYWSSTTRKVDTRYKWVIYFSNGSITYAYNNNINSSATYYTQHYSHTRCVRDVD